MHINIYSSRSHWRLALSPSMKDTPDIQCLQAHVGAKLLGSLQNDASSRAFAPSTLVSRQVNILHTPVIRLISCCEAQICAYHSLCHRRMDKSKHPEPHLHIHIQVKWFDNQGQCLYTKVYAVQQGGVEGRTYWFRLYPHCTISNSIQELTWAMCPLYV